MEVFFKTDWYDMGIRNIMDITNENGLFCVFVELKRRYKRSILRLQPISKEYT